MPDSGRASPSTSSSDKTSAVLDKDFKKSRRRKANRAISLAVAAIVGVTLPAFGV
jgi:hypothetical protein